MGEIINTEKLEEDAEDLGGGESACVDKVLRPGALEHAAIARERSGGGDEARRENSGGGGIAVLGCRMLRQRR